MTEDEQKEFEEFQKWKKTKAKEITENDIVEEEKKTLSNKVTQSKNKKDETNWAIILFAIVAFIALIFGLFASHCGNNRRSNTSLSDSDSITAIGQYNTDSAKTNLGQIKQDSIEKSKNASIAKVLKSKMRFKKDDFNKCIWVYPKHATNFVDVNTIYCYFDISNGVPENFRLRIQYSADDWLFIYMYKIMAGNIVYDYTPNNVERDNSSYIWEWSDEQIDQFTAGIIDGIMSCNTLKIKYIGKQYFHIRNVPQSELVAIKNIVRYYKALGGTY